MNLPARPPGRILRREDAQAWLDGYGFLSAARAEAQRLVSEAEQVQANAQAQGFEHGLREGREHLAASLAEQQARLQRWLAQAHSELADLALGITRQLVGELSGAERIAALARVALNDFAQGQALRVQVPPTELEHARQALNQAGLGLAVEVDDLLHAGQARLVGPLGSVELGLEAQLQQLRRALLPFADGALA